MVWESFRMAIKIILSPSETPALFLHSRCWLVCGPSYLFVQASRQRCRIPAWSLGIVMSSSSHPPPVGSTRVSPPDAERPPARLCGTSGPWPPSARNMTGGHVSKCWNPAGVGLYKVTDVHFTSFLSRFKEATRKLEVAHGSPWIPPGRRRGLLTPSLHSSYQAVLTLVSGAPLTPCIKKDILFF